MSLWIEKVIRRRMCHVCRKFIRKNDYCASYMDGFYKRNVCSECLKKFANKIDELREKEGDDEYGTSN